MNWAHVLYNYCLSKNSILLCFPISLADFLSSNCMILCDPNNYKKKNPCLILSTLVPSSVTWLQRVPAYLRNINLVPTDGHSSIDTFLHCELKRKWASNTSL